MNILNPFISYISDKKIQHIDLCIKGLICVFTSYKVTLWLMEGGQDSSCVNY